MDNNGYVVFAGNSNPLLAQAICKYLKKDLGNAKVKKFSDGEIQIEIDENVRLKDVFVIQSTCAPVNDNLVELFLMIDALKRSSAKRITAVIPYFGYARQDKKVAPRVPISAKAVADMLTTVGAHRIITTDLHANQIQGFFNIPVDNLFAMPVIVEYIKKYKTSNPIVVSPDAGGVERARALAKHLDCELAIIDKRRDEPNKAKAMAVIGDVSGKLAIIIDDMIDTAGTLTEAASALIKNGAKSVIACCAHPVLSGPAIDRIMGSILQEVIVTDTIPLSDKGRACTKIKVISIADIIGEAINRSHTGESVTSLFI